MNQPAAQSTAFIIQNYPRAAAIPPLARHEVVPLARAELARFIALTETLSPDDLRQPTDCALWTVKDVIAHQASHVTALTRVREFFDQFNPHNLRAYTAKGMNSLDAANQRQVDLRAEDSLAQLIAEMRDNSEQSFARRQRFPLPLRWIRIGVPGFEGRISLGELIDNTFTRDMWMHRADICRATGRAMKQSPDHDGRIVALVLRDVNRRLRARLNGRSVIYQLTGAAGGAWLAGGSGPAEALLRLDVLEFNRLASGRITAEHALETDLVDIEGSLELARLTLRNTAALF